MFIGTGCISVSSIQTARTMDEGKTSVYVAATGTRNISTEETDDNSTTAGGDTRNVAMIVGGRYGVVNNLEFQASAGSGLTLTGIKYQYIKTSSFAASIGSLVSYGRSLDSTKKNDNDNGSYTIFGAQLPLYFSLDINSDLSLYTTPRIAYSLSKSNDDKIGVTSVAKGASFGLIYGGNVAFATEVGAFQFDNSDEQEKDTVIQVVAGLIFGRDGESR